MPQPRISRRASKSWDRLRQWYGARLTDQYGEVPPPDWAHVIDRTDDERLDQALLGVRRESPVHPPTLGLLEQQIPTKRFGVATEHNAAEILCEWAVHKLRAVLCRHQIGTSWSYFGPVKEFVSKHRGEELVSHPEIRGVFVPACAECSLETHRVLLNEVPNGFTPARKGGQFG